MVMKVKMDITKVKQALDQYFNSLKTNPAVDCLVWHNADDFEAEMILCKKSRLNFTVKQQAPFAIIRLLLSNTSIKDADELESTLRVLGESFKELCEGMNYSIVDTEITFQLIVSFNDLSEDEALSAVQKQMETLMEQMQTNKDIFSAMDNIAVESEKEPQQITETTPAEDSTKINSRHTPEKTKEPPSEREKEMKENETKTFSQKKDVKTPESTDVPVETSVKQKENTAGTERLAQESMPHHSQNTSSAAKGRAVEDALKRKQPTHNVEKQQRQRTSSMGTVPVPKTVKTPHRNDFSKKHPDFSPDVLDQMSQMYEEMEHLYEEFQKSMDMREKLLNERERKLEEREQNLKQTSQKERDLAQREEAVKTQEKVLLVEKQKLQYEWNKLKLQQDIYQKNQSNISTQEQMSKK